MHRFSKFNLLICNNIVLIIAVLVCLTGNIYAIVVGRYIWGICFGVFTVVCSKYVNEICPIELKGPFGGFNQAMNVFGGTVPSGLALYYPRVITESMKDDFIVT